MRHLLFFVVIGCSSLSVLAHKKISREHAEHQGTPERQKGTVQETSSNRINHLAIIMDGNRRWAKKQSLTASEGHRQGAETVKLVCRYCIQQGIPMVSTYALSYENLHRDKEELHNIFALIIEEAQSCLQDFLQYGIRVTFIGDRSAFPLDVKNAVVVLEELTKECSTLQLNIYFCYGGRQEILSTVQAMLKDAREGTLTDEIITHEVFKHYMWSAHIPDPDLIIRTGGVKRLSNFLAYQSIYSELYFTDKFWPELTEKDFTEAAEEYARRKRTFGK